MVEIKFHKLKTAVLFSISFLIILVACENRKEKKQDDKFLKKASWFLKAKNYKNVDNYQSKFISNYEKCMKQKEFQHAKILLRNYSVLVYDLQNTDNLFNVTLDDFLKHKREIKKDTILALIYCHRATFFLREQDLENALIWADLSLSLNKQLKSRDIDERAKLVKVNCFIFRNQHKKAIETLNELIPAAEAAKDFKSLSTMNYSLATSYYFLNAKNEAGKKFDLSANYYLKAKDSIRYLAVQFTRIMLEFEYKNDTIKTLKRFDKLFATFKNSKINFEPVMISQIKSNEKYLRKDYDSALYYNNLVMDYHKGSEGALLQSKLFDVNIYFQKYKKLRDEKETIDMLNNILDEENYFESANLYKMLSVNAKKENNFKEALFYRDKEIEMQDSIFKYNQEGQLFEFDKKYQSEKKEKKIAQQKVLISKSRLTIFGLISGIIILIFGTILYFFRKKRKQAQAEIKKQEQFTFQLFQNTEEERNRIANELHDSVNHELLNIKNALINGNKLETKEVDNVIEEVRRISRNLHPAVLQNLGFKASIEALCDRLTNETALFATCDFKYETQLSKSTELQMYRIIQEALNNTLKHGKANAAKIILRSNKNELYLEIKDNGEGFDFDAKVKSKNSFGIQSIIQRAKAIAAKIDFNSTNTGTIITLKIPI